MTLHAPDPRVRWTWVLCACVPLLPAIAISVLLFNWERVSDEIAAVFTLLWAAVFLLTVFVYIPLRRRTVRYGLDDIHITVTGGVIFRTRQQMPLHAVRHVTLLRGPLERRFGTAFLWVAGAGGWVLLEGLPLEQAEAIRQRLLES